MELVGVVVVVAVGGLGGCEDSVRLSQSSKRGKRPANPEMAVRRSNGYLRESDAGTGAVKGY